jgi:alkanesulfonate monooxygenase SsuD/methylene tetrahydromethanopterin reductase-like flavin-dependent oxidoreductase (luciferase family)
MKVDFTLSGEPGDGDLAAAAELRRYDGIWLPEITHDPFPLLAVAASRTETIELGTAIAVAFARNPMSMALVANDLQLYSGGRFLLGMGSQIKPRITKRFSMPWSAPADRMREYVLAVREIWHSWATGEPLNFVGEFLHAHTDDAVLQPRAQPVWQSADHPGWCRNPNDAGGRRSGRGLLRARLHHRALPARDHAEMLHEFAIVAPPDQVAERLLTRYGDVFTRTGFYTPYSVPDGFWEPIMHKLQAASLVPRFVSMSSLLPSWMRRIRVSAVRVNASACCCWSRRRGYFVWLTRRRQHCTAR